MQVECVDNLLDMGHGVNLVRKGVSGKTQNQLIEFDMTIPIPCLDRSNLGFCRSCELEATTGRIYDDRIADNRYAVRRERELN